MDHWILGFGGSGARRSQSEGYSAYRRPKRNCGAIPTDDAVPRAGGYHLAGQKKKKAHYYSRDPHAPTTHPILENQ